MKYPKAIVKEGVYTCPQCGKEYKTQGGYCNHYRTNHYAEEKPKDIVRDKFGLTERQLEKVLIAKKEREIKPFNIQIGETYKFAVVSDTHLCSAEEKLEALHGFYDIGKKQNITDFYNAGDVVAGQGVYQGQEYEIHTFGADNQVDYFCENYPKVKGITTHFILGNHDYIYYKQIGLNIGDMITKQRDDLKFLGIFQADVMFGNVPLIRLVHPDGGIPYAVSYRMQKYSEQVSSGKKPNIILSGHQHTALYFPYRNMHILQAGAFEGQTKLILRKGINPNIGGWIVTIKMAKDNRKTILSFKPEWIQMEY